MTRCAPMLPRLPDAEHGAARVGEYRHAAGHIEGLLEHVGAQLPRLRGGLVSAHDGDVIVPVPRLLVLLDDRCYRVALNVTHRVNAATRELIVLELPTEKLAVEGLGAVSVARRQIHPGESSRLVSRPLAHVFLLDAAFTRPSNRTVSLRRHSRFSAAKHPFGEAYAGR